MDRTRGPGFNGPSVAALVQNIDNRCPDHPRNVSSDASRIGQSRHLDN
jgi:hypothetical protein